MLIGVSYSVVIYICVYIANQIYVHVWVITERLLVNPFMYYRTTFSKDLVSHFKSFNAVYI